jgi:hypothetical protein
MGLIFGEFGACPERYSYFDYICDRSFFTALYAQAQTNKIFKSVAKQHF